MPSPRPCSLLSLLLRACALGSRRSGIVPAGTSKPEPATVETVLPGTPSMVMLWSRCGDTATSPRHRCRRLCSQTTPLNRAAAPLDRDIFTAIRNSIRGIVLCPEQNGADPPKCQNRPGCFYSDAVETGNRARSRDFFYSDVIHFSIVMWRARFLARAYTSTGSFWDPKMTGNYKKPRTRVRFGADLGVEIARRASRAGPDLAEIFFHSDVVHFL